MTSGMCEQVGGGPVSERHGWGESEDDLGVRGKEEEGGHEESMDGVGSYGRVEEGVGRWGRGEEIEEVDQRVGEQGDEKRKSEEKVGKLREGPVFEETDIPVDGLDVAVDKGDGIRAPGGGRGGATEGEIGGKVVGEKWRENENGGDNRDGEGGEGGL